MRKNIFITLLVLLITLYTANSFANDMSKQSMSVTVGNKNLTFEAPRGQCFLDSASHFGKSMHEKLGDLHSQVIDKVLLAIILDCSTVSSSVGANASQDAISNSTAIYWLHPAIADELNVTRKKYFDIYEDYVLDNDYYGDKKLMNTDTYIAHYSNNTIKSKFGNSKSFTATASTLIKGLPIEIIRKSSASHINLGYEQDDMEDFINLQIQINE